MHDFLEGVGPYELKLVLYHLIVVDKLFSLKQLNMSIAFLGYGKSDVKNRPSEIPEVTGVVDKCFSLKQKAFQFYCLFRLLPLIIGTLVPRDNPYWHFYLRLRDIADLLFSQKWTAAMAENFRVIYAEHIQNFRLLFPAYKLLPKHHYLSHYGLFALKTGPPYKMMVACEEIKGNFCKRISSMMCNYRNVPYSLANRHQFLAYMNLSGHRLLNVSINVVKTVEVLLSSFRLSDVLLSQIDCDNDITLALKYGVCGQEYFEGQILPLHFDEFGDIVFGRLVGAIVSGYKFNHTSLILLIQRCETVRFNEHLHCYELRLLNDEYCSTRQDELLDYHPLDRYATDTSDIFNVCLRYTLL